MSHRYTVKAHDTLSTIAKAFYGDPMLSQQLGEFNHVPNSLRPGQVLQIPSKTELIHPGGKSTTVSINKELPWGKLVVDLITGRVHLTQRWEWTWLQMPAGPHTHAGPNWSPREKVGFRASVVSQINQLWNRKVRFHVAGSSDFSKKFGGIALPMVFLIADAKSDDRHWSVSAYKDADPKDRSYVDNPGRKIVFYRVNLPLHNVCLDKVNEGDAEVCTTNGSFSTPAHEYGHTIGNDDEYTATSPNRSDKESIENIGTHIRERHLAAVLTELNTLIPDCRWTFG